MEVLAKGRTAVIFEWNAGLAGLGSSIAWVFNSSPFTSFTTNAKKERLERFNRKKVAALYVCRHSARRPFPEKGAARNALMRP
jgi:hypothetical protein